MKLLLRSSRLIVGAATAAICATASAQPYLGNTVYSTMAAPTMNLVMANHIMRDAGIGPEQTSSTNRRGLAPGGGSNVSSRTAAGNNAAGTVVRYAPRRGCRARQSWRANV
jgi:hypothetical protein